jgi:hypothetical protein
VDGDVDGSFKMSGIHPEVLAFFGLADDTAFNGSFRGSFKDQKGEVIGVIATFRVMLEEVSVVGNISNIDYHDFIHGVIRDPVTGACYDPESDTLSVLPGFELAGAPIIVPILGLTASAWNQLAIKSTAPSIDTVFASSAATGPVMRSTPYRLPNFTHHLSGALAKRFVARAGNVLIASTGEYLEIDITNQGATGATPNPHTVTVNRYAPREDYADYLQLPWINGVCCKLKD